MKTLVFEKMPSLFWKVIEEKGWNKYFVGENANPKDVEIAIIRTKTIFDKKLFDNFPNLKLIIRAGSGFDNIDISEAKKRNIEVCNTPLANVTAAAEHTITLILSLIKNLTIANKSVLSGTWKQNLPPNLEISDLKILIVGVGKIGTKVGKIMKFLGAEIRGVDPYLTDSEWLQKEIDKTSYQKGLRWCNLVTFHCPLTPETTNYFSVSELQNLRNPIYLVNVARGKIVEEKAIKLGISTHKLLGVALDVFSQEPWKPFTFSDFENIILSPHIGANTVKAKEKISLETIKIWSEFVFNKKIISSVFNVPYKLF